MKLGDLTAAEWESVIALVEEHATFPESWDVAARLEESLETAMRLSPKMKEGLIHMSHGQRVPTATAKGLHDRGYAWRPKDEWRLTDAGQKALKELVNR